MEEKRLQQPPLPSSSHLGLPLKLPFRKSQRQSSSDHEEEERVHQMCKGAQGRFRQRSVPQRYRLLPGSTPCPAVPEHPAADPASRHLLSMYPCSVTIRARSGLLKGE